MSHFRLVTRKTLVEFCGKDPDPATRDWVPLSNGSHAYPWNNQGSSWQVRGTASQVLEVSGPHRGSIAFAPGY